MDECVLPRWPVMLVFGLGTLVTIVVGIGPTQPRAADLTDYVAQSLCVDEAGRPVDQLPVEPACIRQRPQRSDDLAVYRKHDWPNRLDDPTTALGYQASDSVLERRGARTVIVQTFDFGTGGRTFGVFDGNRGDGGQVLLFVRDWATYAMTEDGGGGIQWFLGESCRSSIDPDAPFLGWLVFRRNVDSSAWQDVVARLNSASTPTACPDRFNAAFTRFRLASIEMPFRIIGRASSVPISTFRVEAIVSEHYGGDDIRRADHLERFYLAKGLGLVRWERWANANLPQPPSVADTSRLLATTSRCPALADYGAPARGWMLVDCRTWTTLVRQTVPWTVRDYGWPALSAFGAVE